MNSLPIGEKFDSVMPLTPIPGVSMKGRIKEYRPGRWRVEIWYEKKKHCLYSYSKIPPIPLYHPELAHRLLEHINSLIDRHEFDPADWAREKPFRFEDAAEVWLSLSDVSPEWQVQRRRYLDKYFLPFFKGMDIRKIRRVHIDNFHKTIKDRGLSEKTRYNILAELKALLNHHRESLPRLLTFPKISCQEKPIRWLNQEQQEQVFQFIIDQRDRSIFTFMRFTGCRPSEAAGLLRENVDFENHQIMLATVLGDDGETKGNTKTRIVKPLPIISEIEDCLKPREVSKFVFTKNGKPYCRSTLAYLWKIANRKATEKYGTPKINLYNGMKHSFGCQRLNAGFSLDEIRQVYGHASTKTTMRYASYETGRLANVMSGKVKSLPGKKDLTNKSDDVINVI